MARAKLGDMLAGLDVDEAAPSAATSTPSEAHAQPAERTAPETGSSTRPARESAGEAEPASQDLPARAAKRRAPRDKTRPAANAGTRRDETSEPYYQTLERKEARLRADQFRDLTECARALNRARRGEGERITENTLIRVAVDLLLTKAIGAEFHGVTEAELRKSVGL